MVFLLLVCLIALAVFWTHVRRRLEMIEQRLFLLERWPEAAAQPVPSRAPQPAPAPHPVAPPPLVTPPPVAPPPVQAPVYVPAAPLLAPAPLPRPARSSEDWEALVGGNWLNKLGVAILVIGIALALGYSFTQLGPAGRVAVSLACGALMLGSGVVFERRERYRIFARGLLGGGWAVLYFTVYAMHSVPAARVIENPLAAAILLLAVAAGMILHSLRYGSRTVTGIAYFLAFITLAITEVDTLAVAALVPLAASLLYITHRFRWPRFALFGVLATYGACLARGDSGAPLWQAQAVFVVFWLLFEAFDLLDHDPLLVPLNAAGFLGLSVLKWDAAAPHHVWALLASAAAAYLAGAIVRAARGHWRVPIAISAGLAAAAMLAKLDGVWLAAALLIEAEALQLAGIVLRAGFLRYLAPPFFLLGLSALMDLAFSGPLPRGWTPVAAFAAAVFYLNRYLRRADAAYGYAAAAVVAWIFWYHAPAGRGLAWTLLAVVPFFIGWCWRALDFRFQAYGLAVLGLCAMAATPREPAWSIGAGAALWYAAALCARLSGPGRFSPIEPDAVRFAGSLVSAAQLCWVTAQYAPETWRGVLCMASALLLLELGLRGLPSELRRISYAAAAFGALLAAFRTLPLSPASALEPRLVPAAAALCAFAFGLRARNQDRGRVLTGAVAPAWAVGALVLLALRQSRQSAVLAAAAFLRATSAPVPTAAAVIATLYAGQLIAPRATRLRAYFSLLASSLLAVLLYHRVSGSLLTVAWGAQGVCLLASGFPLRDRLLRLSGLALLWFCILKLFFYDLGYLETLPRILSFLALGVILVGVSWIYTRFREHVRRYL